MSKQVFTILSEKSPAFMPEMKRILSEDQGTTAFRPWESIAAIFALIVVFSLIIFQINL